MDTFWHAVSLSFTFIGLIILALASYLFTQVLVETIADWLDERRRRRIARVEAELDQKQEQLRRTILSLAEQLAAERDEVSREMTRQAFLGLGKTPPEA